MRACVRPGLHIPPITGTTARPRCRTTAHVKRVVDAPPPPVFGGSGSGSGSYDGGSGSYSSSSCRFPVFVIYSVGRLEIVRLIQIMPPCRHPADSDNSGEGSPNATPTAASAGAATTVLPPVGAQAKASGSSGGGGGGVPVESNGDSTSHARLKGTFRGALSSWVEAPVTVVFLGNAILQLNPGASLHTEIPRQACCQRS